MSNIKKITVATPMYGGQCYGAYVVSILNFLNECSIKNISVNFVHTTKESLIKRARNTLATNFLNSESDVLLFIDSDIKFDARAMLNMVLGDEDVIGAITPLKKINYGRVVEGSLALRSPEKAHLLGGYYNFNNEITKEVEDAILNNKPIKVKRIGTGVMSIKRNVLVKMSEVVEKYTDDNPYGNGSIMYDFFPVTVEFDPDWNASRMMSEDYNFCNNWTKLGGEIWAKDGIVKSHTGTFEYSQSLIEDVKANRLIQDIRKTQK